ncbi:unnamed protein product [Amoebophrya sp. A25]|nr:unnamed protein product [Amoebophrya sp. A25]|eukprot:GSA25T00025291001.1
MQEEQELGDEQDWVPDDEIAVQDLVPEFSLREAFGRIVSGNQSSETRLVLASYLFEKAAFADAIKLIDQQQITFARVSLHLGTTHVKKKRRRAAGDYEVKQGPLARSGAEAAGEGKEANEEDAMGAHHMKASSNIAGSTDEVEKDSYQMIFDDVATTASGCGVFASLGYCAECHCAIDLALDLADENATLPCVHVIAAMVHQIVPELTEHCVKQFDDQEAYAAFLARARQAAKTFANKKIAVS